MRKKSLFILATTILVLVALAATGALLRHEPHFYRTCGIEPGPLRQQRSSKFFADVAQLALTLKQQQHEAWHTTMNEVDLNSFLQDDLVNSEAEKLHTLGVSEPRVALLDEGRIRIGFRYGSGFWSTIISYDLRVWSVPKEPNVVAVEIRGRRIGAIPLSAQAVLAELIDLAAQYNNNNQVRAAEKVDGARQTIVSDVAPYNIEVTPYRYEANPVAIIRFQYQPNQPDPQLKCLHVRPGELHLGGSCGTNTPTALARDLAPAAN
jgi:hypothetical protein